MKVLLHENLLVRELGCVCVGGGVYFGVLIQQHPSLGAPLGAELVVGRWGRLSAVRHPPPTELPSSVPPRRPAAENRTRLGPARFGERARDEESWEFSGEVRQQEEPCARELPEQQMTNFRKVHLSWFVCLMFVFSFFRVFPAPNFGRK